MPRIHVTQPFKFAHGGYRVEEFSPGPVDTTDECAAWAVQQGVATASGQQDQGPAPENKDAAPRRRTKSAG